MSDNSITACFDALRTGFSHEPFPELAVRIDRLKRLRSLLICHEQAFCAALSDDYGHRSTDQSAFADITTTIKSVNHALKNLKFWMARQPRSPDLSLKLSGARCAVQRCPKGVVGIVSPWNFPINLTFSPLVSILAAGNRAMIKPSEMTPNTAALMKLAVAECFDADEVSVVCGGEETARAFVELPFDHLIYTGSERVARSIMQAASKHLVPLTLELGGKSPVIVDSDADVAHLAKCVVFGKYFNAGQVCIAPDYVLLSPQQLPEFVKAVELALAKAASSTLADDSVSVINDRHRSHLSELVLDAKSRGARVQQLHTGSASGYQLTLVIDPPDDAHICQREIFGPVLLVRTCDSLSRQIEWVNSQPHPLVIYFFGRSRAAFNAVTRSTQSGAAVWNDIIFQYANDDLPFGGVGNSGMGRYRGVDGFEEFSNRKALYQSGWMDVSGLVTPPYNKLFQLINQVMRKL